MDEMMTLLKVAFGFVLVFLPVWAVLALDWILSMFGNGTRRD